MRGPPVLKIGLNPAPELTAEPSALFAMLVATPNVPVVILLPNGPKLG